MKMRTKVTIGVLVVVGAMAYLLLSGFGGNTGFEKSVSAIIQDGAALDGQNILVDAKLVPGSATWDSKNIVLSFDLTDGREKLPVTYNGITPDNFYDPEAQIIVEGRYSAGQNVLVAERVQTRCPTKYEALEEQGAERPAGYDDANRDQKSGDAGGQSPLSSGPPGKLN